MSPPQGGPEEWHLCCVDGRCLCDCHDPEDDLYGEAYAEMEAQEAMRDA